MAQVKISALPQQTSTTILDVLAIVDSGSTQTSKITLSDMRGLTNGSVPNSLKSASGLTTTGAVATSDKSISIGDGAVVNNAGSISIGAYARSTGDSSVSLGLSASTTNTNGVAIGYNALCDANNSVSIGANNTLRGSDSVCIGANAILNSNSGICIGRNAQGSEQTIAMGYNIINYSQQSVSIGTAIQHQSQVQGGVTIGYANDMLDNGGGNTNVLIGYDRTMRAKGGLWIASNSGTWVDYSNNSVMFGGRDNLMSGSTSIIINGSGNTVSNLNTAVIGGTGNTASLEGSMMLNTFDRTSVYENTVHAENEHIFKTESFSVLDAGNVGGSVDIDCSQASVIFVTMTAATTPNFINWRDGQRIQFFVTNTTYNVPGATVDGVPSTVFAKNGSLGPANNSINSYAGIFHNGNLYLDEETNFSAV